MRKIYWYVTAYIRKHGLKFLLAIAIGVAIFSVVVPYLLNLLSYRDTYYVGFVGEYQLNNLPDYLRNQLSRGLMTADTDGSLVPELATKLTIENDGKRYRFELEEGLFWQDGQPFASTDINYTLPQAQVTYEAQQITYDLPEVFASFPQLLTRPLLRYQTQKVWNLFERERVYGLSDTILSDYQYTDSSKRALSQVVLDNLVTKERYIYRFYYTQDQAVEAYKLGKVDYLLDVTNVEEIKNWPTSAVNERLLPDQYLAVFFNTADPLLTKNLRQALSYAVEKERPGFTRAVGPITENSWAFFRGAKRYDKNIQSGVERLLTELPGEAIELALTTTASYFDLASRVKEDWEELGAAAADQCLASADIKDKTPCEYLRLKVTIHISSFPDTNNFQTLLVGQQVSTDPDQYALWHSGLATNFTRYKNTKIDSLLERGRQTLDTKERLAIYQEFQQDLLDDPPAVFLWYLKSSDVARR